MRRRSRAITAPGREIRPLRLPTAAHILTARPDTAKTPPIIAGAAAARPFQECVTVSRANFLFTSESVSEGHPDKVCDQISDAILDAFLENDIKLGIADDSLINTRLGCETLCTTNKIVVAGEGRGQLFRTINGNVGGRPRADHRDRARRGQGHRLRPGRLLLSRRRRRGAAARPVARHRHGRQRQEEEGRRRGRRRRPGHDVRLRLHRERGLREGLVHAGADLLRAQDPEGAVGEAPLRPALRPAARRQEPGHGAVRQRQAGRLHQGRGLDAAQRRRAATARNTRRAWSRT